MNDSNPCAFEHDDGAYVIGALSAADRLAFERHLGGCEPCTQRVRELAGLPGLLGRVNPDVLVAPAIPPLPPTVLPALAASTRRIQRRRTTFTALLAAAAAALIVGTGAVVVDMAESAPSAAPVNSGTEMAPVGDAVVVEATLDLEKVAWGTRIGLECNYRKGAPEEDHPPDDTYILVVRTDDGRTEQVGTWRTIDERTLQIQAGTATPRSAIAAVEVRTTDGRVVLTSPA